MSISLYKAALERCYATFKTKSSHEPKYYDFDYFCFHTPFSKMVQKSFFHLLFQDLKSQANKQYFPQEVIAALQEAGFKNDDVAQKIMMQHFGREWRDKCERTLFLAKQLGNVYTGSLFNGLLSLLCDTTVDLKDKKIMMFSFGSGLACSMFVIKVLNDQYKNIQDVVNLKSRIEKRVKINPEDFNKWMIKREQSYGKAPYEPTVRLSKNICVGFYRIFIKWDILFSKD